MLTQKKLDEMVISAKVRIGEKVDKMKQNFVEREGLKIAPKPPQNMGGE